ncbi:MAG: hypothetical protein Satyrvirus5_15 [Satyrvirus sp.]|uniref:Uncharacterized protein n=1 Tax=Satyrvirus sp. TaxID=2487771 RepID=A0A3G5AD99_9VIRU|nr:MAG: hypothetical protein Satyrvirus5_15 [Satyrvirus sp.]
MEIKKGAPAVPICELYNYEVSIWKSKKERRAIPICELHNYKIHIWEQRVNLYMEIKKGAPC